MSTTIQLLLGSGILIGCSLFHFALLFFVVDRMDRYEKRTPSKPRSLHWMLPVSAAYAAIVFGHSVQVWVWAVALYLVGAIEEMQTALYFALVTYTTVGYGDVVLGERTRIFASMAAVTGVLNFGLSTAFLVGILTHSLPKRQQR